VGILNTSLLDHMLKTSGLFLVVTGLLFLKNPEIPPQKPIFKNLFLDYVSAAEWYRNVNIFVVKVNRIKTLLTEKVFFSAYMYMFYILHNPARLVSANSLILSDPLNFGLLLERISPEGAQELIRMRIH